jgi:hypothetical protein
MHMHDHDPKEERAAGKDPLARKVVEALWPLLDACTAFLDAHDGHDCDTDCSLGQFGEGFFDQVFCLHHYCQGAEGLLNGELGFWPASCRRSAEEYRREGNLADAARYERWAQEAEAREAAAAAAQAPPESALSVRRLAKGVGRLVAAELRGALERLENAAK